MVITPVRHIENIETYCEFQMDGFEWYTVGLFTYPRIKRKLLKFDAEDYLEDCRKLGFTPYFDGERLFLRMKLAIR